MWDVLDATPGLRNRAGPRGHVPRPEWRPQTHFDTRGQRLGHGVRDLLYDRDSGFGLRDSSQYGRPAFQMGRVYCRERVSLDVSIQAVAASFNNNNLKNLPINKQTL